MPCLEMCDVRDGKHTLVFDRFLQQLFVVLEVEGLPEILAESFTKAMDLESHIKYDSIPALFGNKVLPGWV